MKLLLPALLLTGCRSKDPTVTDTGVPQDSGPVDADADGYDETEDCDDANSLVSPGAEEICDGADNDCDGEVDEGVTSTFYADDDDDGFGSITDTTDACETPDGHVAAGTDCDDGDPESYPGAPEQCDGIDNDCDGEIDEDVLYAWYADADGDGFGDPDSAFETCDPPPGYVEDATDCDDTEESAFPGGAEVCDEVDNDCDDTVDENVTTTYYQDTDGDGFGIAEKTTAACDLPTGYADQPGDCDDADGAISPNAAEVCDEQDNDCDGATDEDDAVDAPTFFEDADGDGFGNADSTAVACEAPSGTVEDATDCDDADSDIHPDAAEVCNDIDDDCDGDIDTDATDMQTFYADSDGDGYGGTSSTAACDQPTGYADNADDCDDGEAAANPGESEVCDDIDNDCDGSIDEGVTSDWYLDYDGDGYGAGDPESACEAPTSSYVAADGDCDDTSADHSPGAAEGCDGEDYNCDGDVDSDADGDGYADIACGGDDCDDADASVLPEVGGGCALGTDCLDILERGYDDGDGTYTIDPDGYGTGEDPFDVICDMTTDGGGWTALVDADYSTDDCPDEWYQDTTEGLCQRNTARDSAPSAPIDAYGIEYDEVMGELTAYQYASTNAFWYTSGRTVEDIYVDGISITVGEEGSRSHVFTYAVGYSDYVGYDYDCPDLGGIDAPDFVGDDYLCDSGSSDSSFSYTWYSPALFSGEVFQVTLDESTTDDVEVRIMCDEESSSHSYSEDVGISEMTLYIR